MLTVRIQAIDGTGTFTLPDFQPCRLLIPCSGDFSSGARGLHHLLGVSLSPCCRFHPAEMRVPRRSDFDIPCCLRPTVAGSALGSIHFRGHICVYCRYGPVTRNPPEGDLVDGLQDLGDFGHPRHPAIRTTGLLTLALAGLSPAEHTSLHWSQQPSVTLSRHSAPVRQTYRSSQAANARRDPGSAGTAFQESDPRESCEL
jgi:hypothetical protein